jgi:hypothetical protein
MPGWLAATTFTALAEIDRRHYRHRGERRRE